MSSKTMTELVSNDDVNEEEDLDHSRDTWKSPWEFLLSCVGFAVGFGNIWRFPFLCFKNGGAAFLIPYSVMLLIAGIPMFFLELSLGQYVSLGPNVLFPELSPIFTGVGWAMMVTTGMTAIYFNMVFAWCLFYTFSSFTSVLPWTSCDNNFNTEQCFTYNQEMECKNQSLYYYNHTCLEIEDFCAISNLDKYNATHCGSSTKNQTKDSATVAEKAVVRITASEDFYKNRMLGLRGATWDNMGEIRWELVGCLALAWIIVCACMIKGVNSSGKVVYVTATLPYLILLVLLIRGLTLEGSYKGLEFYILKPNMTKLMEVNVWADAATQIFYSLGTSFGGLITLSSYNKFRNNCMRDAITVALMNCGTSIFAGFVIFSILGFMAHEIGVEVKDVSDSGVGLAFIAYPEAVTRMPLPPLWASLFFVMLIFLGIDSQFTYVETLSTGLFDQFPSLRSKKPLVMICLCLVLFLMGVAICLQGGVYMFDLLNHYSGGLSVLFIAICEVICIMHVYGYKRFMKNITEEMCIKIPKFLRIYWYSTWLVLTPCSLLLILIFSIWDIQLARWGSYIYPHIIQVIGWLTIVASVVMVPLFVFIVIFKGRSQGKSMKELLQPTKDFCPAHLRKPKEIEKSQSGFFKYFLPNEGFMKESPSNVP